MVRYSPGCRKEGLTPRRAILHDEEAYPEPFKFKPERFLPGNDNVCPDPITTGAFGFGRRYGAY